MSNRYANAAESPADDHTTTSDAAAVASVDTPVTTPAPEAKPKTLQEKIDAARASVKASEARLSALLREQFQAANIDAIKVDVVVTFEFGRAEKKRTLTGKVVAIGDDEKLGRMLAVQAGEGLDIQTYKIRAVDAQIVNPNEEITNA